MSEVELSVVEEARPSITAALGQGLTEHAAPHVSARGFLPLAVLAHDGAGAMVGGAQGLVNWNWLHLQNFWVEEALRGQGLGTRLLRAFEQAGVERGCRRVHLDTLSFQARPFYERFGYRVFGQLDDYHEGHQRFFMEKSLLP